ncbi:factor of DNA methylation 1-like [Panicum miliaceum]|uniref:Factor of DNA methylation 1-like n=1 Tax=Panicum miliaceum TaxID=4540 RepID=A0A3L6SPM6_PANMI|nr:factor of DNA methylation 1-like [Panicum miliaceum]
MASSSSAGAADLAGGEGEVGGLGDQSVRGSGVVQPVALGGDQDPGEMPQGMDFTMKLNEELKAKVQGFHKDVFEEMTFKHAAIRIKMMGQLNEKPFEDACRWKYGKTDDEYKFRAVELISVWQGQLKDPSWHPFRIVEDANGKTKQVVDDVDGKLRRLRDEYGDDVRDADADRDERAQRQRRLPGARALELRRRAEGDGEGGSGRACQAAQVEETPAQLISILKSVGDYCRSADYKGDRPG